jgi:two-component system, cell cycle sensor histidine kinase and response regulator CckA
VEQIILNLVVNARDAMSQGGRLILAAENVELEETYAGDSLDIPPATTFC